MFLAFALLLSFQSTASAANPCSANKMIAVRAPATVADPDVWIACNLTLGASEVITKTIKISSSAANDITINCNGADLGDDAHKSVRRIEIESDVVKNAAGECIKDATGNYCTYDRPENVTIRDCDIFGRVDVGSNQPEQGSEVTRHADYTQAARMAAPRNIRFEEVRVYVENDKAFYVYPGVERFQLIDSYMYGSSPNVALYLDRESHGHEIRNNEFRVDTDREIIAVDGSSENLIVNNYFSYTKNGGIFLYRNCGEGGYIRHTTPSFNHIINNRFNNGSYAGDRPNIWLGARNGYDYHQPLNTEFDHLSPIDYCDADLQADGSPYPWGSSASNLDYANYNVVMQNQFYNRSPEDMVVIGRPVLPQHDRYNVIAYNEQVSSGIDREAGCYLPTSITSPLLEHGVIQSVVVGDIEPTSCERLTCDDGVLATTGTCPFVSVDFSCQVTGNNSGCHASKACPTIDGRPGRVATAKAACNLESGSVSNQQVYEVFLGEVMVVRASDTLSDGVCYVEQTDISYDWADIWTNPGDTNLSFGCMEYDSNGGDCHIKGKLYCE